MSCLTLTHRSWQAIVLLLAEETFSLASARLKPGGRRWFRTEGLVFPS